MANTNNEVTKGLENITVVPTFNKTGKIKVSKQVGEVLDILLIDKGLDEETMLDLHHYYLTKKEYWTEEFKCFNKYTLFEFAEILIKGYEVESTPEEEVLARINELENEANSAEDTGTIRFFKNYKRGMIEAYETLTGKKVEL